MASLQEPTTQTYTKWFIFKIEGFYKNNHYYATRKKGFLVKRRHCNYHQLSKVMMK